MGSSRRGIIIRDVVEVRRLGYRLNLRLNMYHADGRLQRVAVSYLLLRPLGGAAAASLIARGGGVVIAGVWNMLT